MRYITFLLVALLIPATLANAQGPRAKAPADNVTQLVDDLNHKNRKRSAAAYRRLYKRKPAKAVQQLVKKLPGFAFAGQNYGMLLLGRYPQKQRRPALQKLLKSGVPFLQVCSAIILHRAGGKKVLPQILAGLKKPKVPVSVRATMIRRLDAIDEPSVMTTVRDMLVPGVHFSILAASIDYFWKTKDPAAVAAVGQLHRLKTTTGHARVLCGAFMLCQGRKDHAGKLSRTLAKLKAVHTSGWTYLNRAGKLDKVILTGVATHAMTTKNITSLQRGLTLLRTQEYAKLIEVLRKVANHKNEKLAKTAFKILAEMPDQLKLKELRGMLSSQKPWLALFAADTLRRRNQNDGLQRTLEIVAQKGKHHAEAVRVLGGFRNDKAVQPLIDNLNHPKAAVRRYAFVGFKNALRGLFPYRRFDFAAAGYSTSGAAEPREFAIQKIQAWWDQNKG